MSPRQSKSGSRSARRTRSARSGSKSAGRRAGNNTRRAAASRRGSQSSRQTPARAKRGRRSESSASYAVKLLQQDHRTVAEALEEFESAGHREKQEIAGRICKMLKVHTQIEEELLYPAAREALDFDDVHLVAEARVEHGSVKDLIAQIEAREAVDEQYEAEVRVMGEFVKHHVREEETELFPKLERSSIDLDALGERLEQRKRELMGEEAGRSRDGRGMHEEEESGVSGGRSRGVRGHRSASLHARRR
ncbi:MAG TPA: hemerythrin domain-containing protein [Steroidobacteraceae bacterium]|jgi:hemerythrin superfamily protein|nr:hemerythrin domain-containing protein [Steroidobacteraceae bacterium]